MKPYLITVRPVFATCLLVVAYTLLASGQDAGTANRPPFAPDALFKQFDKNGDGKLSADQFLDLNLSNSQATRVEWEIRP